MQEVKIWLKEDENLRGISLVSFTRDLTKDFYIDQIVPEYAENGHIKAVMFICTPLNNKH